MQTLLFHTIVLCGAALGAVACSGNDGGEQDNEMHCPVNTATGGSAGAGGSAAPAAGGNAAMAGDGAVAGSGPLTPCGGWPPTK